MLPPKLSRPRDLREALGFAFIHRKGVRWRAGTSAVLNVAYEPRADGPTVVDVRDVADFHTIRVERGETSIGAFVDPGAFTHDPRLAPALGSGSLGPHEANFRLGALGARVLIAGPGATRTADLESLAHVPLPAHEIPVAITLRPGGSKVWFADRRIKRTDGLASFDLRVHVGLAIAAHRIVRATVAYGLSGGPPVPMPSVTEHLDGKLIGKSTFAVAARHGADVFSGDDERTSVLRRTIIPLLLSALADAYATARAARH